MITEIVQRTEENKNRIYTILIKDVFLAFLEDQAAEIQYIDKNDFLFPLEYKENKVIHLCNNDNKEIRVVLFEHQWFLLDTKPKLKTIEEQEIRYILTSGEIPVQICIKKPIKHIKYSEKKGTKKQRKELLMIDTIKKAEELSNEELLQTIQIYIEKFQSVYPFEPDFRFQSTQRGYIRDIECRAHQMFLAKIDIPRETRVITETVTFQREKAIDIVLRFQRRWKLLYDITNYTLNHQERIKDIDWEIESQL